MKNRKGKVKISRELLKDELEVAQLVFARFVPVFIVDNPFNTHIEYYGFSLLFEEIAEPLEPPYYDAIIKNENETYVFKEFRKVYTEAPQLTATVSGKDLQFILDRNNGKTAIRK